MNTKYIFITGGVISSLGKGITTASLGLLLKSAGYRVTAVKCDMYVNVDAGTIRPTEHGEVFVGVDGIEADQDLGNYERFLDQNSLALNYITTGQIYQRVIQKERNLEYGGEDVEVVPHIPEEIIFRLKQAAKDTDSEIVLVELGGTVGEYQNILFVEADRMLKISHPQDVINVHLTYLPTPKTVGEMKSKPAQQSLRILNSLGIQPEFVIGRATRNLDLKRKEKISVATGLPINRIISNPDVNSIYQLPLILEEQGLTKELLSVLGLEVKEVNLSSWKKLVTVINKKKPVLKIGVIGKYFKTGDYVLADSYVSVIEALKHACWDLGLEPELVWVNSDQDLVSLKKELLDLAGILVPGGFGSRGVAGKLAAIKLARENKIPFFGICYGMQLSVVEFAQNKLHLDAHSREIDADTKEAVIDLIPEQAAKLVQKKYGATMRLGAYDCCLVKGSRVFEAYQKAGYSEIVSERHRHRYEVNGDYQAILEKHGLQIVGQNPKNQLIEIVELKDHPWFVGVQFHPEFQSRPQQPHPLFQGFIKEAAKQLQ